jgi:VIT1/CCC1 family predicted Fe2+/Mn2+ transporter
LYVQGLIVVPVLAVVIFLWALLAEVVRRRWGRRALWVVTAFFAVVTFLQMLLRTRPRVYPEASLTIALVAIALIVLSLFIAPAYGLDRAARNTPRSILRQAGSGTIVGVLTFVIGYLVAGLVVFVLARLGWSAA